MDTGREGDLFILGSAFLWGIFPVVTTLSFLSLAPLSALAWTEVFAAIFFAVTVTRKKAWREVVSGSALGDILLATFILGVLFYICTFIGLKYTTPGNVSLIELTEIFFAFVLFNLWHKEEISGAHILGCLCMVLGAAIVLYPNFAEFHAGDLLIVVAAAIAPFGNYFSRRARTKVTSETIMFVRSIVAAGAVFCVARLWGEHPFAVTGTRTIVILALNGVFLFGLSKIFWLEGIHRISVTRANALSASAPLVTLLTAYVLLGTPPSSFQLLSFVPMFLGAVLLGKTPTTGDTIAA